MAVIGVIGLAVMGQNLAFNIADKGFRISVYNRTTSRTDDTERKWAVIAGEKGEGQDILKGYHDIGDFVRSLEKPRRMIMLVKAGAPVDMTLEALLPHIEAGDIVIDGGNEWYLNSERRGAIMAEHGIRYMAMGVSGGEEGARNGPSLMPGGPPEAYEAVRPVLERVAAQLPGGDSCVTYIGPGGSGNYVKMVHNGIEYGDMQLIAEAYDVLRRIGGLSNEELAEVFSAWNEGELQSFLIEITAQIFAKEDDLIPGARLVDSILDRSGSKGTGKMTVQESAERAVAAPTICAALDARYISAHREERIAAAEVYPAKEHPLIPPEERKQFIDDVRAALYCSKMCSYAQGMDLIRQAAVDNAWGEVSLPEVVRIWKGGCIIRAVFLDRISAAFAADSKLPNLLLDSGFAEDIRARESSWRRIVCAAVARGIPSPALSASLQYFDSIRAARLPANLIQAQRDFFGAHTFERTDREGTFHATWA